jgi:hypothetical protein
MPFTEVLPGPERDNHGQHHRGHDLSRSPLTQVEILPDLALGGSRFAQALVGAAVPGRSG